jgi:hypothetical protein
VVVVGRWLLAVTRAVWEAGITTLDGFAALTGKDRVQNENGLCASYVRGNPIRGA